MFGQLLGMGKSLLGGMGGGAAKGMGSLGGGAAQNAGSMFGPPPNDMAAAMMRHGMSAAQPGAPVMMHPLAGVNMGRPKEAQQPDPRQYIHGMLQGVTGQQWAPNGQPMSAGPMGYLQQDANQAAADGARDYILRTIMSRQGQ